MSLIILAVTIFVLIVIANKISPGSSSVLYIVVLGGLVLISLVLGISQGESIWTILDHLFRTDPNKEVITP